MVGGLTRESIAEGVVTISLTSLPVKTGTVSSNFFFLGVTDDGCCISGLTNRSEDYGRQILKTRDLY